MSLLLSLILCFFISTGSAMEQGILGYWQNTSDEQHVIGFEKKSMIQSNSLEEFRIFPVEKYTDDSIKIPVLGGAMPRGKSIRYQIDGEELKVERSQLLESNTLPKPGFIIFKRLVQKPASLIMKPLVAKPLRKLTLQQTNEIKDELIKRMDRDQQARKTNYTRADMQAQADDFRWLRDKVLEVGWIDIRRFGSQANFAAFLIAQHCLDMRLRKFAERGLWDDLRDGHKVQGFYTILYDRNLLYAKGVQKFGSHFYSTTDKKLFVLPFENRARTEEWRRKAKIGTWKQHLKVLEEQYKGHEVRIMLSVFSEPKDR